MKRIKPPSTFDNSLNSGINCINNDNIQVKFKGNCLTEEKLIFKATYILYCLWKKKLWLLHLDSNFMLWNSLFSAVKLTKNGDHNQYSCSGYDIGFHAVGFFQYQIIVGLLRMGLVMFAVDVRLLMHVDNKRKDILILSKAAMDGLTDTTLTWEKSILLVLLKKKIMLK